MRARGLILPWIVLAAGLTPGCGLLLDSDPPDTRADGGRADGSRPDAAADAVPPDAGCQTDLDCDDGDPCTFYERCVDHVCMPGTTMPCDDSDPCNGTEGCVEGVCMTVEPPPTCGDDGDPCNGEDVCIPPGGCVHIDPPDCGDDGIDCTVERCTPFVGCESVPEDSRCADAPGGTCDGSVGCVYPGCGDTCLSDECYVRTCLSDRCVVTTRCADDSMCCGGSCVPAGCDDGNPCTADGCVVAAGGCVHRPRLGPCDDGDPCTGGDYCDMGECRGSLAGFCPDDGDPCTEDMCIGTMGCVHMLVEGLPCDDGDACTRGDRCEPTGCTPGALVGCMDDGNPCTAESCDSSSGCISDPVPEGTPCGPTRSCDGAGHCNCSEGLQDCDADRRCECLATETCSECAMECGALLCGPGSFCCALPDAGGVRPRCCSLTDPLCCVAP